MADTTGAQQVDDELNLHHRAIEDLKLLAERNKDATDKRFDELMALMAGLAEEVRKLAAHMEGPLLPNPGSFTSPSSRNLENDTPETVFTRKEGNTRLSKLDLPTFDGNGEWTDEFTEVVEVAYQLFDEMPGPILEEDLLGIEGTNTTHDMLDERPKLSPVDSDEDLYGNKDPLSSFPYILEISTDDDKSNWVSGLLNNLSMFSTQDLSSEHDVLGVSLTNFQSLSKLEFVLGKNVMEIDALKVLDKLAEPIQTEVSLLHLTARDFSSHSLFHDEGNDYIASKISNLRTGLKIMGYGEVAPELHLLKIECLLNTGHMFDKMSTMPSAEHNEEVDGMFLFDPGGSSWLHNGCDSIGFADGCDTDSHFKNVFTIALKIFDSKFDNSNISVYTIVTTSTIYLWNFESRIRYEFDMQGKTVDLLRQLGPKFRRLNACGIGLLYNVCHSVGINLYYVEGMQAIGLVTWFLFTVNAAGNGLCSALLDTTESSKKDEGIGVLFLENEVTNNNGSKPFAKENLDRFKNREGKLHYQSMKLNFLKGFSEQETLELEEQMPKIHDGLIDQIIRVIEASMLKKTIFRMEQQLPKKSWLREGSKLSVFEHLVSFGIIDVDLQTYVWEPGQYMIPYILEDKDVLKRKGIGVRLALKQDEELNGILTEIDIEIDLRFKEEFYIPAIVVPIGWFVDSKVKKFR